MNGKLFGKRSENARLIKRHKQQKYFAAANKNFTN